MQDYRVRLESPVSHSFRCQKAANSLDIDVKKKSVHELNVKADLEKPYNIGLIVGASGSGKTTLAHHIFGEDCFAFELDESMPIIEQFPEDMSYDECASMLSGIGLTSVPCWIRPVYTLSNGQRARAIAALQMSQADDFVVDEWTSVVDRTVAKAMSNCLQKFARRQGRRVTVLSCHYDVIEWLNPDWIIDCNKAEYIDRRLLRCKFQRTERLTFDIAEVDPKTWRYFSKYHYLSDKLPGGLIETFGVFHGDEQIGFQCFANYCPREKGKRIQMHFNRTVIHPDYIWLGLGIKVINITSAEMCRRGYDVRAKLSSVPVRRALVKHPDKWRLISIQRDTIPGSGNMIRKSGFRRHVKTCSYKWIGGTKLM